MASTSDLRLQVITKTGVKTLISFNSTKEGGLWLTLWNSETMSHFQDVTDGRRIIKQRYNIHASPKMLDTNAIKHILYLEDGEEITSFHHTKAIKLTNNFAPVFFRLCPHFDFGSYSDNETRKSITLPMYDPDQFTLVYGIFVGSTKAKFNSLSSIKKFISHKIIDINNYRIVVLYSFINLTSSGEGDLLHIATRKEDMENLDKLEDANKTGLSPTKCFILAYSNFISLGDRRINWIRENFGPEELRVFLTFPLKLFAIGSRDTQEWRNYIRKISSKLVGIK